MAMGPLIVKEVAGVAVTAGTPAVVWDPAAGKKVRLCGWDLGLSVAGAIIFKHGAGNAALGVRTGQILAGSGRQSPELGEGVLVPTADDDLKIDVTASGTVHGFVWGFEE